MVDLDDRAFAAALREALDLRVLARADAAITMRHVLMGEAVYGDLLALERVQVHARWAATLSDAPAALVAHHWYEAGDDERAFDVGLVAAREATHAMAFDLAHRQYAQVLSLWDRVEEPAERAGEGRSDMALHAAETANWAGDPANAVAVVDEALAVVERAEREPREERDEAMASVLLERRAWYLLRQGANDAARKAYDAALAALPETADAATRARVLAGSVRAWERSAEYDRALTLAQEAVDVAVSGSVAAEIGPAQYMLGRVLLARGDIDDAIAELEGAAASAEDILNPVLLAIARLELGDAYARQGRLGDAVPAALASAARLRARGDLEPHALLATAAAGALLHRLGRPAEGRVLATEILDTARAPVIVAIGHLLAGAFDVEALRLASGREHLETARILAASLLDGRVGAALASARTDLAFAEGNLEAAASAVDEGIAKVEHSGDDEALAHLCLAGLRIEAERDVAALGRGSERSRRRRSETIAEYERRIELVLAAKDPRAVRHDLDAIRAAWNAERTRLDGEHDPDAWAAAVDAWDTAAWPRLAAYAALRHAEALAHVRASDAALADAFADADARAEALDSPLLRAPIAARRDPRRRGRHDHGRRHRGGSRGSPHGAGDRPADEARTRGPRAGHGRGDESTDRDAAVHQREDRERACLADPHQAGGHEPPRSGNPRRPEPASPPGPVTALPATSKPTKQTSARRRGPAVRGSSEHDLVTTRTSRRTPEHRTCARPLPPVRRARRAHDPGPGAQVDAGPGG